MKRSAPTGYGQWETVREEEPVVYDLGLPNQPAYHDTPTEEATTKQVDFSENAFQCSMQIYTIFDCVDCIRLRSTIMGSDVVSNK